MARVSFRFSRFSFSFLLGIRCGSYLWLLLWLQDSFAFTSTCVDHSCPVSRKWTRPCPRREVLLFRFSERKGHAEGFLLLTPSDDAVTTKRDDPSGTNHFESKVDKTIGPDESIQDLLEDENILVSRRRLFGIGAILVSTAIIPTTWTHTYSSSPHNHRIVKPSYGMEVASTSVTILTPPMEQNKTLKDILTPSSSPSSSSTPLISTRRAIVQPQNNTISIVFEDEKGSQVYINRTSFEKVKQDPLYPPWVPSIFQPKAKEFGTIPDSQVFVAGIVAGSILELIRSTYLYPLSTIKTRIQNNRTISDNGPSSSPAQRLQLFWTSFRQQIELGKFYAGIQATLFASVPAAGIYFGARDVTKRELIKMTSLDDLSVTLISALVADIFSIAVRTPALTYSTRRQAQSVHAPNFTTTTETWNSFTAMNWIQQVTIESWGQLPTIIITDLPYLLLRIAFTRILIHSQPFEDIGTYELYNIFSACICAAVTTPFDVARTRILVDSDGDPSNGLDGGSGVGVWETLIYVMNEQQIINNTMTDVDPPPFHYFMEEMSVQSTGDQVWPLINEHGDEYSHDLIARSIDQDMSKQLQWQKLYAGWFERTLYFGVAVAWLDPIRVLGYLGIRDALLLEWFK